MSSKKCIYIVLSQTGSMPSKLLKFFTRDEYNHISISLSRTLDNMFSFGRRFTYFPFIGGFVEEGKNFGIYKRFANTKVKILELNIEENKFKKLKSFLNYFALHKKDFGYSYLGVVLAALKKRSRSTKNFYCSQFVRICLALFNIENARTLPVVVKPMDFLKLNNIRIVYSGLLKNYR